MEQSQRNLRVVPVPDLEWRSLGVTLPPREDLEVPTLTAVVGDVTLDQVERKAAALQLAYLGRLGTPLAVSSLRLGTEGSILHLPGEAFVEYQLFAAQQAPFVAVAAYGDTGPGYIPLARSFDGGGYEVTMSAVSRRAETKLKESIRELLRVEESVFPGGRAVSV
jgi:hypothetical protein